MKKTCLVIVNLNNINEQEILNTKENIVIFMKILIIYLNQKIKLIYYYYYVKNPTKTASEN